MRDHQDTFAQATQSTVLPLGYKGEVSEMIERDMNLVDAVAVHLGNWGYSHSDAPPAHEAAGHLPLGMLHYTHPELMEEKFYQGDYSAEIWVFTLQDIIQKSYSSETCDYFNDKEAFIKAAQQWAREYFQVINFTWIMGWLHAQSSGKSYGDSVLEKSFAGWEMYESGKDCITLKELNESEKGVLHIISEVYGSFYICDHDTTALGDEKLTPYTVVFPENLSGNEVFKPFSIPSDEEASAFYNALLPAIHFFQEKIYEYRCGGGRKIGISACDDRRLYSANKEDIDAANALFSQITVGELVARMRSGKIFGRDAEPEAMSLEQVLI